MTPLHAITHKHSVSNTAPREFVFDNLTILLERIFGDDGFRIINTGYTISRIPLHGPLRFFSNHTIPPVWFNFVRNARRTIDTYNNTATCSAISLTHANATTVFNITNVDEFSSLLHNYCSNKMVGYGATFRFQADTVLTNDNIEFLTHAVNYCNLVIVYYSGPEYPSYSIINDHELSMIYKTQLTASVLHEIVSTKLYGLKPITRYDTRVSFASTIVPTKPVTILPITRCAPILVFENLHDAGDALIDISKFCPRIVNNNSEFSFQCLIGDDEADMVVDMPNALQTLTKIYKVQPLLDYHIVQDLQSG